MIDVFADYQQQRLAFEELCKPECNRPILFFEGASGYGKTALLRHCQRHIPADMTSLAFDCKTRSLSISEIFSRSAHRLGWKGFTEFRKQVNSLSKGLNINLQGFEQRGDQNTIDIVLRSESEEIRENRRTLLTEAWFDDVNRLDQRLLMIVDTFEKAEQEVREWFCGPFLARIPDAPQLRVLVAGQKIPDAHTVEYGDCCQHHSLLGISEAREWLPVVEAMGRQLDVPDPTVWLGGVCFACNGRPDMIINALKRLPLKKEVAC